MPFVIRPGPKQDVNVSFWIREETFLELRELARVNNMSINKIVNAMIYSCLNDLKKQSKEPQCPPNQSPANVNAVNVPEPKTTPPVLPDDVMQPVKRRPGRPRKLSKPTDEDGGS